MFGFLRLIFIFLLFPLGAAGQEPAVLWRIGAILPLTGPASEWGRHLRNGVELAGRQQSAAKRMQFFFEDDHLDAREAVTAYRKLRAANSINALILFGAQSARAVVPLADKDEIVSFAITMDPGSVKNAKYALRLAFDAGSQAELLLGYLRERRISSIALIGNTHDAMLEYLSALKTFAPQFGVSVALQEDFPKEEVDFRTFLERVAKSEAHAVVNALLPGSLSAFAKQLRHRLPQIPLLGCAQAENEDEIVAADGALEGSIVSALIPSDDFARVYRESYGYRPHSFAAYTYDVVKMLEQTGRSGEAKSTSASLRSLTDFAGASGTLTVSESGVLPLHGGLLIVKGGQLERLTPLNTAVK